MNDERFEQLWQGLREQVRAARGERPGIFTMDGIPVGSDRVSVGSTDSDGASLHVMRGSWSGAVHCNERDLVAIAAQCVAAAIEIEEAKEEAAKVRPTTQQRA